MMRLAVPAVCRVCGVCEINKMGNGDDTEVVSSKASSFPRAGRGRHSLHECLFCLSHCTNTPTPHRQGKDEMVDYSRFDKIGMDDGDDDEETPNQLQATRPSSSSPPQPAASVSISTTTTTTTPTPKGKEGHRLKFEHGGQTIYEWEQTLEDVSIYITPPPGVKASMLNCTITPSHLTLGLKEAPHPFIDEATAGPVKAAESFWTLEDGELHILLQKASKGEVWPSALAGRGALDPLTSETVRKQLMLERFQEENPGFDFSNAEFNGAVPDPQTFLGGVKYT